MELLLLEIPLSLILSFFLVIFPSSSILSDYLKTNNTELNYISDFILVKTSH